MKVGVKVEGVERVVLAIRNLLEKHKSTRLVVGYSAPYAVYVHENMRARHTTGKAKFLEDPARQLSAEVAQIVRDLVGRGVALAEAMTRAGQRLLQVSQAQTPVLTGFLRRSGFARVDQ